jgi:starch phosphorylase
MVEAFPVGPYAAYEAGVDALAARVPPGLRWHARVALDLAWTWQPGGDELFAAIDPRLWLEVGRNPVRLLATASRACLEGVARDRAQVDHAEALARTLDERRARSSSMASMASMTSMASMASKGPDPTGATSRKTVAYFCAEFALHASLPIYGGGLGALAGDLLKQAADAGAPVVGVGLLYRRGYFRQRVDPDGRQHEFWSAIPKQLLPIVPVLDEAGAPRTIGVPIRGHEVRARLWCAQVGSVPLYLLDADLPENDALERWITAQLYVADRLFRLTQYALLGLGGVRALRAVGVEPDVVHLNEGHPALAALELARDDLARGVPFAEAMSRVRERVVFTTHTPVPAGNEHYEDREVEQVLVSSSLPLGEVLALGRGNDGRFGMTELALRVSRTVNAVSARHGEVARAMWRGIAREDAPIRHVTNGVHLPTWMAPPMRALLARHLGAGWEGRAADPSAWAAIDRIPDEELWGVRELLRGALVGFVRERSVLDRLARGEAIDYVEAAARSFDPSVLTIGFARRVAAYKRLHLLIHDRGRALALLGAARPIQVVLAGKAHPRDEPAKELIRDIFTLKRDPIVGRRVAFLEDYDLAMAQVLVAGCDVWVNLPRPPQEACGTSGMKAALNGGLNLAVLDGWWPEASDGTNGWAIPSPEGGDEGEQDARDAGALYDLLEREILPLFHARDAAGIPRAWLARVRASLRTIGPRFCAARMLDDYAKGVWEPARSERSGPAPT